MKSKMKETKEREDRGGGGKKRKWKVARSDAIYRYTSRNKVATKIHAYMHMYIHTHTHTHSHVNARSPLGSRARVLQSPKCGKNRTREEKEREKRGEKKRRAQWRKSKKDGTWYAETSDSSCARYHFASFLRLTFFFLSPLALCAIAREPLPQAFARARAQAHGLH